jgi:hypothetical protein
MFTIQIQTSDGEPAEAAYNCDPQLAGWGPDWTAEQVATDTARFVGEWRASMVPSRIAVWNGADADTTTEPAHVLEVPANPPVMTAQQLAEKLIGEFAARHRATRCAGEGWGDVVIYAVETAYGLDYQSAAEHVAEEAQEALASQD